MSTATASPVPPAIDPNDPRLTQEIQRSQWEPPSTWDESSSSPDDRAWIETMAELGLRSKACSAFECGDYYIPILLYRDHYVRLGRATCQNKTCRDCGTGKMRVHRMYKANPRRFEIITSESCRTLRLTVHYSTACATIPEYLSRVWSHRVDLVALRRRIAREFKGEFGYTATPEFDPRCKDVIWRIYFIGYDPGHRWFQSAWQQVIGLRAQCESKHRGPDQEAKGGLRWTMDAITNLLMLPGALRAQWEAAMCGYRFTSCVGTMRGVEVDQKPEIPDSGDPEAPYGRCPCGCGGALERPDLLTPAPRSYWDRNFTQVDCGAIKTYTAKNRPKVTGEYQPWAPKRFAEASPPPS